MNERLVTPIIATKDGATLWLCDSLRGESIRLAGQFDEGDILAESNASDGLGGVATRMVFRERSDGTQLNWCGIPFQGDVIDVTFPNGELANYTHDELDEWATPRIDSYLTND